MCMFAIKLSKTQIIIDLTRCHLPSEKSDSRNAAWVIVQGVEEAVVPARIEHMDQTISWGRGQETRI